MKGLSPGSVAQGLAMPEDEFLRRLSRSGAERLLASDGTIPLEAVDRIVTMVRATPDGPAASPLRADGVSLDDMMRKSGVRRLDGAPDPARGAPSPRPAPPPARPPPAPAQAIESPPPKVDSLRSDPLLRDRLLQSEVQLDRARQQITELREQLAAQQGRAMKRVAELEQRLVDRDALAHELQRQLDAAKAAPEPATGAPSEPPPAPDQDALATLNALLRERGLIGEDEAAAAVRALIAAHRWAPIADTLQVPSPDPVRATLQHRLVLHCEREGCPVPAGVTPVRVGQERCEMCGGTDAERVLRRFSEALLLHGLRRLLLVGGALGVHRILSEHVDHRIELRLVPGNTGRSLADVRADRAFAQLVLLWDEGIQERVLVSLYDDGAPPRTIHLTRPSLARSLEQAIDALEVSDG